MKIIFSTESLSCLRWAGAKDCHSTCTFEF